MSDSPTVDPQAALERYARRRAFQIFGEMGWPTAPAGADALTDALRITPAFRRLLDALIDVWTQEGLIDSRLRPLAAFPLRARLEQESAELCAQFPAAAPHVHLLDTCVDAYPEVLRGQRSPVEVLFPGGSLELVEPIYRGDDITRHYNAQLARLVERYVSLALEREPNRQVIIVEAGAGTGGSTPGVVARLRPFGPQVRYVYTDVSTGFLDHGRRLLEGEPIATEFHTLDLERCPVAQGYEGASVDLVFGVNVFHATRNCTATLRRLRTLLRANGLALVGEACANWTFSTLTFGLTDGWWRFDDPELRLPHSPLLSPEGWSKAFVQAGYHHARAYARPTDGWTIVGAESAQPLPAQAVPKTQPSTCPASPPIEGGEVADWVRRAFQEVTKLPMASLKSDETFENFGVDSLVAIKIARKLEETVGKLPTTLLFEHPTIDRLAAHLAAKYAAVQPTTAAAATPQPTFAAAHPEPARDEDIAIIGLAARFPGADSLDAFWQLLCEGRSAIGDLPADRWPWFDRSRLEPGTRRGGFLAGIDRFDPLFFRLSPREAAAMDPQERLFLQAVWWALEDAAYTREGLRREFDRSVGVFAGIMNTGYEWLGARAQALGAANGAHNAHWSVANRVSYFLDLAGPSLAVDTACSSSLTALHLACESLRRGECRLAFAGGVNLVVSPEQLQRLGRLGMLAKDGRSRSFGAGGTGMVDGEGVGVAVLRPLQEALAAGDRIYAVIKGSAINAGGKTSGYTVPSPDAQGAVVAQALRRAGVAPEAISYVEAHGTGTPLGDPIELAGLTRALGNTGPSCALGSVKSNLGHLESAAGIAGLIKVVLQLQHHELVPSLEAEELNPEISWSEVRFAVQRQRASWLASGLRQAGLSSFGAGGANAHVVIAEAPTRSAPSASHAPEALVLSALDADRLAEKRRQLAAHLRAHPELSLADIAHTLQVGREAMEVRWGAVVASHAEALRTLEQERPSPANTALGQTLARWLSGEKVDWAGQRNTPARRIALPLYPFAQERCWIHEPATSDPTEQSLFRGDEAYFADHVLQGSPVLPGAALLAAAAERLPQERLTAFTWRRPVRADALASLRLEVHGEAVQFVDAQGAVYADARRAPAVHQPELLALETAGRECTASMIYPRLEALGLRYGPSLRVLKSLRLGKDGAVAQLSIPQTAGDSRARMTALLDAALQATAFALGDGGQKPMLPRQIGEVQLARPILTEALLEVRVKHLSAYAADVQILAAGEPIAWLQRAEFQPFAAPQAAVSTARPSMLEFLRRLIAAELELAPERLHKQRSFDAYGVDSVLMLRVVERLEQTFGEQPKTLLFEHPTLEALASYFADRTVPGEAPSEISEAVALSATPAASEPSVAVAIIGLAGRFPGPGASGLLALEDGEPGRENQRALGHFWHNLWAGHDAVTDIPEDRWDWRAHHEADKAKAANSGQSYAHWGAFLEGGIDRFDALFFGISPREAELMDPQERLFLEAAWQTVEDAGYTRKTLSGKRVGVYAGVMFGHYQLLAGSGENGIPNSSFSSIANRVSHVFDWRGPSVAVDTMCSSSLSAIHLACESLRRGESELALAGGVNLIVHPQKYALLSQGRFASTDGRCRAFGEGGDGYVPGEGVGAVLLKPLERALADGDAIHAVIRGSALNHGGRLAGSGYTVPSPLAQADVIRQALEDAGVPPESISYIEAHGTGTALGDPVEISGLSKVFGQAGHAIAVGSVKSNIGHLESAAGIAGLTKVLLQLKHRRIAPSLLHHPEGQLNAKIDFASTPFVVPTEGREWASTTGPRRAALSAFGAGGSNAHLILEEAPEAAPAHELASPQLIVLSAQNKSRLQAMARELAAWLEAANNGSNALPRVAELLGVNPSDLCLDDSLTDCGLSADQIRQLASESGRDALTAETHLHELAGGNRLPLAALAATLQTARETMPERLAFVASSVSAVISHLRNFLEGQAQDLWLGRVEEEAEDSFDPFDLPLDEVARRWVAGQPVTWAVSGPRLRLPGTLFGGRAHWIRTAAATPAATSALLHPLLHRNVSRLHGAAFETTWQASDSLLRDHQIQHRATLPGATCVEMLQAAAELATGESPSTLTDIAWLQPLQVADGPKTTRLELQPQGDALRASLRSGDTLLAQATIASTQALQAPTIDLARWRAEASEPVPLGEFYPEAARRGLSYGPTLRTLESVWRGPEAVVVQLRLRQTGICRFAPELLDGALQATAFLGGDEGTGWLPVALERVQLHQPLGPEVWVRLVESSRTADERVFKLTLADPTGLVCLQLDGLHVRRLSPEKPRGPAPLLLHKIWKGCQTTSRTPFETVVTAREGGWQLNGRDYPMAQTVELWASLRGIDRLQLTLDATDPLGSLSSFFQGALKAGVRAVEVACVVGDNVRLAAAVAGFGRSLARENAAYRLVSIEGPISSWTNDPFIEHLRKGQRPAWQELAATPAQTRLRKGGVYWITGGASGVGRLVARHLACNYQAHLVLSGRRSPDRETESLLAELQTTGAASVTYLACDVASRASVDTAVAAIEQQHGRLHGIFHSAGVLRDRLLPSKMAEDWQSVEAPKVDGVRHLDAGTVHLSLDFLVLFSSIAAELGGMGQTDYAFANGYLDGFAAWREAERLAGRRKGVCRSINWPYWREGGMRLSDAALKALDANLGLQPLETVAGLEVLETILAAAAPQVMVLPGDTARLRSLFLPAVDKPLVASTPTKARPGRSAARLVTEVLAEVLRVPVPDIRLQEKLDRYGVDSVAAMALTDALEQKVGSLPKTLLYECDTVSALAEQLQELHPEAFKEDIETAPTPAPVPMPSLITSTMALEQMTTADDAVAVIGLSGRYPASPDLDTLWENLRQGRNCVGEIPASRWEAEGASGSRFGGFIEGIEDFDPLLFQISPREAEQLDPQARLFLEAAWHAFEDAGYSPLRIAREQDMAGGAGVWVSSMYQHYPYLLGDTEAAARLASGAHWTIVNRTSYCFDLRGPSLSVDTACSGSLTALHLACESIRRGEVPFALVGGINLTLHRGKFAALQQMNLLSKGDETRSLGQGDGFVAGEGVGACILKPLAAARRDGDRIYGIIRGSAVNHGGRTNGFTVPSVQAQATLIERGLARAGLRPTDIDCVEVAANGSPLGDPIEFSALKRVFRSVTTPVRLGSVKSNLGHLEAASGLSQLTKVLLQFQAQTLVPTLHADPLNPAVELGGTPFRLQQTAEPWTSDKPCRVLIDSFGAGGANAMLVVESVVAAEPAGTFPGAQLLPLSARTPEALRRQAASLRAVLAGKHAQTPLADVAYTLQIGRAQLAERLALTVENTSEAVAALDEFLSTQSRRGTHWERDTADARLADAFDAASLQAFAGSLHRLALLWIKGAEVDWEQVLWAQRRARVVSLPGYAFDRVRCWLPDSVSPQPPVAQVVASTLESPSAGGLREIVAELLKLEPAQLDADCDLRDYGFDSLLGLQLIQRLQETFGVSISPVELFDQPTLAALEARLPSAVSVEKSEHTSASSREPFALSRGQAALWSLARLDPDDYAYNLPCGFRIRQALDTHAFAEALDRVVARHEALQVTVEVVDGQPRQRLLPEPPKLELISWSGVEEGELPDRLLALGRAPFTLEGGPLFRAQLVQLGAADYALVLTAHHIVFDGMSLTVLLGELIKAYEALRRNQPVELEPLPAQYRDFVAWQQEMLAGSQGLRARQYWTERLAGELPQLELPTDRARGAQPSPGGAVFTAELDASTTEQLKALARREGVNLFTLMCGTWCALLHRYSGERRIIVGTPVAGRPHSAFGHLVGYFANLMPLVQHIEPETPFRDLLKDLQRALLEGVEHGDYPFSELIHHLDLERSPDSNPVFRVVFGFQNWLTSLDASTAELLAAKGEAGDRLVLETIPEVHQSGEFDLMLSVVETSGKCLVFYKYRPALFDEATLARMHRHYVVILQAALADAARPVAAIPLLDMQERRALEALTTVPSPAYPREQSIEALFAEQVDEHGERTAISCGERKLTYRELEHRADCYACGLLEHGVKAGDAVCLRAHRSVDFVAVLLGILRLGAYYVPIDPTYPEARVQHILELVWPRIFLDESGSRDALDFSTVFKRGVNSHRPLPEIDRQGDKRRAYVMFTSGSTGEPKGVEIPHRGIVRLVRGNCYSPLGPDCRVAHLASVAFDAATYEIWGPLLNGGEIVLYESTEIVVPDLANFLAREQPTALFLTAGLFDLLAREHAACFAGVQRVLTGGDVVSPVAVRAVQQAAPDCEVVNAYGPTENTTFSTYFLVPSDWAGGALPLGSSIAHTEALVCDASGQPAPLNVWGEICLGGDGLANGYFGNPKLTAQAFVAHPLRAGQRIYRTGDRGRWRADGLLEFGGRLDRQVKIRGFRIELGDIESALQEHPQVEQAAVFISERPHVGKQIEAVLAMPGQLHPSELRAWLRDRLPPYMLPAQFHFVRELPLNRNGKVDRSRLAALAAEARPAKQAAALPPRDPVERRLAEIWQRLLDRADPVGREDDFFELGGHSLVATQLITMVEQEFGVQVSLRTFFAEPTVAALARWAANPGDTQTPEADAEQAPALASLTAGQAQLWFLQQVEPSSSAYNVPLSLDIMGELDAPMLIACWQTLVERHEALRTRFVELDGEPRQELCADWPKLEFVDAEAAQGSQALDWVRQDVASGVREAFDLAAGPPWRGRVYRVAAQRHVVCLNLHHIIVDGWSAGLLLRELGQLYEANLRSQPLTLSAPGRGWFQIAQEEQTWLASEAAEAAKGYWRRALQGAPPVSVFPPDRSRGLAPARGANLPFAVPSALQARLFEFCRRERVTPYTVLLATLALQLRQWTGEDDCVIGTPVANRSRPGVDSVVGYCVNTLAMRQALREDDTFRRLLERVSRRSLEAFEHQRLPFDRVVELAGVERRTGVNPLFQIMLSLENNPKSALYFGEAEVQRFDFPYQDCKFDLTFEFSQVGQTLEGWLEYDASLYDLETVQRIANGFEALLACLLKGPDTPLREIPAVSVAEVQALQQLGLPPAPIPPGSPLFLQRWGDRVQQAPHAVAVHEGDRRWTYEEIDRRSSSLAAALGRQPAPFVGVLLERSTELVVAILAIWKAGRAYLPLSRELPAARLQQIVADAGLQTVIGDSADPLPEALATCTRVKVDAVGTPHGFTPAVVKASDPAYMIYTSGSTGRPKGVVVTHGNVAALCVAMPMAYELGARDRVLQFASPLFDVSVEELFPTLATGGTVVPFPAGGPLEAREFELWLAQAQPTVLNLPTAFWQHWVRSSAAAGWMPESVRLLIVGGEAPSPEVYALWRQRHPRVRWLNGYGPTETTVTTTVFEPGADAPSGGMPIGRPLAHTQALVMDPGGNLLPRGATGELWLGGPAVAQGYWQRPELTANAFVHHPLTPDRLYRTGDRVRWNAAGQLEFHGRIDGQVKVRGFRIELGEVEACLHQHPAVLSAAVAVKGQGEGAFLAAYAVLRPEEEAEPEELRAYLIERLPPAAVPARVLLLPALPLNASGKIDRRALPEPVVEASKASTPEPTPAETKVLAVWREVLHQPALGVTDDFFASGGQSLLAVRLVARLREAAGLELSVGELIAHGNVRRLVAAKSTTSASVRHRHLHTLQSEGDGSPLYMLPGGDGECASLLALAHGLGRDRPFHAFETPGLRGECPPHRTIEAMARALLRLIPDPKRGWWLGGWSMGGVVAFEMVRQCEHLGLPLPQGLVVLDSFFASEIRHVDPHWTGDEAKVGENGHTQPFQLFEPNEEALVSYAPTGAIHVPVYFFEPQQDFAASLRAASRRRWRSLAQGSFETFSVPGNHFSMLQHAVMAPLAEHLRAIFHGQPSTAYRASPLPLDD